MSTSKQALMKRTSETYLVFKLNNFLILISNYPLNIDYKIKDLLNNKQATLFFLLDIVIIY
mgnify:CR=1 FL=1